MGAFLEKPKTDKTTDKGEGCGIVYGVSAMQGWRMEMENEHVCRTNFTLKDWSFFGVFDGFSGPKVSQYCAQHLLDCILECIDHDPNEETSVEVVQEGIRKGFLLLDERLNRHPQWASGEDRSGTTAIVVMVSPDKIFWANCGDSRGLLCRKGKLGFATVDHKPYNIGEMNRIERAGGTVMSKRVGGSLAVSRALGGFDFKRAAELPATEQQVSPEPEVTVHQRDIENDEFLLLACDGVFDVMSNEEVISYVLHHLELSDDLSKISSDLIDTCLNKGSRDNMSVILVTFPSAPTVTQEAIEKEEKLQNEAKEAIEDRLKQLVEAATDPLELEENYIIQQLSLELPDNYDVVGKRPFVSDLLTVLRKEKFGNTDNKDFGGPSDPSDASELVFTHGGKDFFSPVITTTDDHTAAEEKLQNEAKEATEAQLKPDKVAVSQRFKEAMAEGFVESRSAKGIMMGTAGSGKTCSMCVILEEPPPPPQERQSTPLAQRPIRAVRFYAKNHSKLRQVKTEEMKRRLAEAINAQIWERKLAKQKQKRASTTQSKSSRPQASSQTPSQSTSSPDPLKEEPTLVGIEATSISSRQSEPPIEDAGTQEELLTLIEGLKPLADAEEPLLHSDFVYIIDTGGQPMFHEVLPVFLRNASLCMFVIKLCERLDKIPDIEYFESGRSVCEPVPATQTNEQILKHCVTTIHSHSSSEVCPSILVIGTHKDVLEKDVGEGSCSETLQEKNQKVREILLPEFECNVISYSDSSAGKRDLIFPINAQNPGDDDRKVAEEIHKAIVLLIKRTPSRPIPLRWYALELTLRDIAEKLDKLVLSWEEAFSVARQKLLFSKELFNEAVEYLDDLNIILYYKDILPHVIFCDPHVLIEKISELAKCSFELRNPRDPRAVMPEWRRFKESGLISKNLLESEQLQKHFQPNLFTPANLIKLFQKLLLLADVSSSASEYFMPCLLPTLPSARVDENRVSPSAFPAPLIVKLPSRTPRHGVFCSLISFLRSDENSFPCKWNIKTDQSFTPECLFRNCAKFEAPDCPAMITLIDSTDFIEVHVDVSVSHIAEKFRHQVHLELCSNTQEALLAGLKKANSTLGYSVTGYSSGLKIAFACPRCEGCDVHASEAKGDALVCDKRTYSEVQENHRIWFTAQKPRPTDPNSPANTASAPTSPPQESDREPLGPTPKASPSTSSQRASKKTKGTISRFLSSLLGRRQQQEHSDSRETIGEKPSLAQLKLMRTASGEKIEIIKTVATRWRDVGILLDFDPEGETVREIEYDYDRRGARACCQEMFMRWLAGGGRPVTWATLIEVLEDEDYVHLAGQVRLALGVSD